MSQCSSIVSQQDIISRQGKNNENVTKYPLRLQTKDITAIASRLFQRWIFRHMYCLIIHVTKVLIFVRFLQQSCFCKFKQRRFVIKGFSLVNKAFPYLTKSF